MEQVVKDCKWLTVGDEDGGEYCRRFRGTVFTCVEWLDVKSPFYREVCPDREEK